MVGRQADHRHWVQSAPPPAAAEARRRPLPRAWRTSPWKKASSTRWRWSSSAPRRRPAPTNARPPRIPRQGRGSEADFGTDAAMAAGPERHPDRVGRRQEGRRCDRRGRGHHLAIWKASRCNTCDIPEFRGRRPHFSSICRKKKRTCIEAVKTAGKPLVVVLDERQRPRRSIGPIRTPTPSWKPGIRAKKAARRWPKPWPASTIPAGRLPVTFYKSLERPAALHRLLHDEPHLPLLHRHSRSIRSATA